MLIAPIYSSNRTEQKTTKIIGNLYKVDKVLLNNGESITGFNKYKFLEKLIKALLPHGDLDCYVMLLVLLYKMYDKDQV